MNASDAEIRARHLAALAEIGPMPSDAELEAMDHARARELVRRYGIAVAGLLDVMDDTSVRPLLESMGHGYGFGVYEVAAAAIESCSRDAVRPAIMNAVTRGKPGPKMWAVALLSSFVEPDDLPLLRTLARDQDDEVRYLAARALGALGDPAAADALTALTNDVYAPAREAATASLEEIGHGH